MALQMLSFTQRDCYSWWEDILFVARCGNTFETKVIRWRTGATSKFRKNGGEGEA